jgi:hypothetical protein
MSTSLLVRTRVPIAHLLTEEQAPGLLPAGLEAAIEDMEIPGPIWVDRDTFAEVPAQASSRFPARGVSHAMLDAVRDVALYAASGNAAAALSASKDEWTDAREPAGFPDLPTAESFRQRIGITHWRSVLAVSFLPAEQRRQAIGTYTKKVGAFAPGAALPALLATPVERSRIEQLLAADDMDDHIVAAAPAAPELDHAPRQLPAGALGVAVLITARAINAVAHRLGHTPAASEYDQEVREMEDARRREGLPPLGFPSSDSVVARFGSWTRHVRSVGSSRRCALGGRRRRWSR